MTSPPVVWIHGDSLSPRDPALAAHPESAAIFVFDDVVLDGYRISLKRIVFLYECLLELPVEIRRGDVASEVIAFARRHGAERVVTTWTPAPRFTLIAGRIAEEVPIDVIRPEPFVDLPETVDLARFSRFWKQAEAQAMGNRSTIARPVNAALPGFEDDLS